MEYFNKDISLILAHNIPIYILESKNLSADYVVIKDNTEVLSDSGIDEVAVQSSVEDFSENIKQAITSGIPILLALNKDNKFDKLNLIIGIDSNNSLQIIEQEFSDTLSYRKKEIKEKDLLSLFDFKAEDGTTFDEFEYFIYVKNQKEIYKDADLKEMYFDNYRQIKEKISEGLQLLQEMLYSFLSIIDINEIKEIYSPELIEGFNSIINTKRVTSEFLKNNVSDDYLTDLHSKIEGNWVYIRNQLLKFGISNFYYKLNLPKLQTRLKEIIDDENNFFEYIVND